MRSRSAFSVERAAERSLFGCSPSRSPNSQSCRRWILPKRQILGFSITSHPEYICLASAGIYAVLSVLYPAREFFEKSVIAPRTTGHRLTAFRSGSRCPFSINRHRSARSALDTCASDVCVCAYVDERPCESMDARARQTSRARATRITGDRTACGGSVVHVRATRNPDSY